MTEPANPGAATRFARRRPRHVRRKPSEGMALFAHVVGARPPVSQGARHALLVLALHADGAGVCYIGQPKLAAQTGIPVRSLRRRLKELAAAGLIEVEPYLRPLGGGQGASTYRISASLLEAAGAAMVADLADDRSPRSAMVSDLAISDTREGGHGGRARKDGHGGQPEPCPLTNTGGGAFYPDLDALLARLPQPPIPKQRARLVAAFEESPEGFRALVEKALAEGRRPIALLMRKVEAGEHRHGPRETGDVEASARRWFQNVGCQLEPPGFQDELARFGRRGLSPDVAAELADRYQELRAGSAHVAA